jgi:aspartate racemase
MSNRATVEYYNYINQAVNERLGGWDIAETIIIGCNFGNIEYFVRNGEWELAEEYLLEKARLAQAGGAEVLICMSNTMHKVLSRVGDVVTIPFIHIAAPTASAILDKNLSKVGLLGTLPVMSDTFMREEYEREGISIIVPSASQQQQIDSIIFDELVKNIVRPESKKVYLDICEDLVLKGAQGVILGCTEIFLLINASDMPALPLFNTTELHVNAAVSAALAE